MVSIFDPRYESELLALMRRVAQCIQSEFRVDLDQVEKTLVDKVLMRQQEQDCPLEPGEVLETVFVNNAKYYFDYRRELVYTHEKTPKLIGPAAMVF